MPNKILSFIIPAFNAEATLPRAIESILASDLSSYDIWIVDDGSTDRTFEIASAYQSSSEKIQVIRQQNKGQGAARNTAFAASSGSYVWFLDSDDWVEPSALTQLEGAMIERSSDVIVFDAMQHYDKWSETSRFGVDIWSAGIFPGNKVFSREIWARHRFPEDLWYEDLAIVPVVIAESKRTTHLGVCGLHYSRANPKSQTNLVNTERYLDMVKATRLAIDGIRTSETFSSSEGRVRWEGEFVTWQVYLNCSLNKSLTISCRRKRWDFIATVFDASSDLPDADDSAFDRLAHWSARSAFHSYRVGHYRRGDLLWYWPRRIQAVRRGLSLSMIVPGRPDR